MPKFGTSPVIQTAKNGFLLTETVFTYKIVVSGTNIYNDLWFLTLVKNLQNNDTIGGKGRQSQFLWVLITRPDFVINTTNLLEKF